MSLESKYVPAKVEDKWNQFWNEQNLFHSEPNEKEAYTIVIPPPNVTGVLHMGHMLNNTIQDILIRRARMKGKNACWVPGTDHASIATEAKVVNLLAEQGIDKNEIGREAFLKHAWDWKEKHDGIIFGQLKKLGASCDWERSSFTMDDNLSKAVNSSFIKLFEQGNIYRGARMINWDPKAKTALSDEEVTRKEVNSTLYYVKYQIEDEDAHLTVATTRPETILGDTAICVHPDDERYKHLKGKKAIIPMVNRIVPIIFDEYVDIEFGTGALKITPAHDLNDYNLGLKHKLEIIDTLNEDGTMSEAAGFYIGEDRFKVRKLIIKDLKELGAVEKEESIKNNVGYSERNPDTVVEPRISTQWFLKMEELVKPAIKAVNEGEINIHPNKFKKVYNHWLENINDWCISRQLWWGHRIPAWFDNKGNFVVAENLENAILKFEEMGTKVTANEIHQDDDVLDTWFSSWLWPFSVFNWGNDPNNGDLKYYYPTNDLVTGHDIIFFWVARMIIAGYHFTGQKPFNNVYFTGMVRDKQGRKMSKSLGNSPDALKLMEEFGADGVRVGMMLCAPAGNDLPFDESLCSQGRNFANKMWNALRLVDGWEVDEKLAIPNYADDAVNWFESKLNHTLAELEKSFDQFRISEALMTTYKFIWDDFCSWYLEMVKPLYGEAIDPVTLAKTKVFFEKIAQIAHPFMPFITEEIWQHLKERGNESVVNALWPEITEFDKDVLAQMTFNQDLISSLRQVRKEHGLKNKESIEIKIVEEQTILLPELVLKLINASSIELVTTKPENGKSILVGKSEFFIPLNETIDIDGEKSRITKEVEYLNGFLKSVNGKLNNERFVSNAPDNVIQIERNKKSDAEAKIKVLEEQLNAL